MSKLRRPLRLTALLLSCLAVALLLSAPAIAQSNGAERRIVVFQDWYGDEAAQAALLLQHGPEPSCEAFLGSRLTSGAPAAFGTLPLGVDCQALMARVLAP